MEKEEQFFASKGKNKPVKKIFISGILSVLVLLGGIFTIGGFFSKYAWIFDLFTHFRFHYFIFFLIMSVLCLLFKRRKLLFFALLFCLTNLITIIPLYIPYGGFY